VTIFEQDNEVVGSLCVAHVAKGHHGFFTDLGYPVLQRLDQVWNRLPNSNFSQSPHSSFANSRVGITDNA